MTQSPNRIALAGNTTEATGATNPYERAKIHIAYGYGLTGAGVKVGVVDSGFNLVGGVATHQDFDNPGHIVLLTSTGPIVTDSHGIHVSGLLSGERDGLGTHGVAYGSTLYLGMSPSSGTGFRDLFNEYRTVGVMSSSNSYGIPMPTASATSPWNPVLTEPNADPAKATWEVTARNALAYRDANGLTSGQMMANIFSGSGTAADWDAAVASMAAYQAAGGVIVWANSNYGTNATANGSSGLNDADLGAALPLAFTQLSGAWITVVNATSRGLAVQSNGAGYVAASTAIENNIFLNSAPCGLAANFCLSMDGLDVWSGSNTGATSYESQGGTSQATPQVAGMVALLREAFPTASAADLTARLLFTANNSFFTTGTTVSTITTASYTNANGTITHRVSNIWGHGFPDMQRALNPVGVTATSTEQGQKVSVAELVGSLSLGAAFGNGAGLADANFLFNDQLNGVFAASASTLLQSASSQGVSGIVADQAVAQDAIVMQNGNGLRLSFSQRVQGGGFGERAQVRRAFSMASPVGENAAASVGYGVSIGQSLGFSGDSAIGSASFTDRMMSIPVLDFGKDRQAWGSASFIGKGIRASFGMFGTTDMGLAEIGSRVRFNESDASGSVMDVVFDGPMGSQLNVTSGVVDESQSFLGSTFRMNGGLMEAATRFNRFAIRTPLSDRITATASMTMAETDVTDGGTALIGGFSRLSSDAMAINVEFRDVIAPGTRLSLGLSRPMGISTGEASLNLPSQVLINAPGDYSYIYSDRRISLASGAREVDLVVDVDRQISNGLSFGVGAMLMSNPGHVADAPLGFATTARMRLTF